MLNQQTIEKLYAMRMRGMADAFTNNRKSPRPRSSVSKNALPCWWTASGTGDRTGCWSDGSEMAGCKVQPAWKTSTSARRAVWTSRWSDR